SSMPCDATCRQSVGAGLCPVFHDSQLHLSTRLPNRGNLFQDAPHPCQDPPHPPPELPNLTGKFLGRPGLAPRDAEGWGFDEPPVFCCASKNRGLSPLQIHSLPGCSPHG